MAKQPQRSQPIAIVWQLAKDAKLAILNVVFLSWVSAVLSVVSLSLFIPLLLLLFSETDADIIANNGSFISGAFQHLQRYFLDLKDHHSLLFALLALSAAIFATFLIKNLLSIVYARSSVTLRIAITEKLRNTLFASVVHASLPSVEKHRKSDIASIIISDVGEFERSITSLLDRLILSPALIVGFCALLYYIEPVLSIFSMLFIPLHIFLNLKKSTKQSTNQTRTQKELTGLYSSIVEMLSNFRSIKLYGAQSEKYEQFAQQNRSFAKSRIQLVSRRDIAGPINEIGSVFALCVCIAGFAGLVHKEIIVLSPLKFIAFVGVFSRMLPPIRQIAVAFNDIHSLQAILYRFMPLLNLQNDNLSKPELFSDIETIAFNKASFSYGRQEDAVFSSFSYQFARGRVYAIAGKSGAGKTTLLDCICGLRHLTQGQILCNDNEIKATNSMLRNSVSYVGQKAELFEGTLYSNIMIAGSESNYADIDEILSIVGLQGQRFAKHKAETQSAEEGKTFSGGEAQRLAIARALANPAPILILDEATSAIDPETEQHIMQYLQNTKRMRICIMVSHRLKTLQYADEILVIDNGTLAESGSFDALNVPESKFSQLQLLG